MPRKGFTSNRREFWLAGPGLVNRQRAEAPDAPAPLRAQYERAREWHRLQAEDGFTMREVGDLFGVSRERVRQVLLYFGFRPIDYRKKHTPRGTVAA